MDEDRSSPCFICVELVSIPRSDRQTSLPSVNLVKRQWTGRKTGWPWPPTDVQFYFLIKYQAVFLLSGLDSFSHKHLHLQTEAKLATNMVCWSQNWERINGFILHREGWAAWPQTVPWKHSVEKVKLKVVEFDFNYTTAALCWLKVTYIEL